MKKVLSVFGILVGLALWFIVGYLFLHPPTAVVEWKEGLFGYGAALAVLVGALLISISVCVLFASKKKNHSRRQPTAWFNIP